jgi:hypothetical protein
MRDVLEVEQVAGDRGVVADEARGVEHPVAVAHARGLGQRRGHRRQGGAQRLAVDAVERAAHALRPARVVDVLGTRRQAQQLAPREGARSHRDRTILRRVAPRSGGLTRTSQLATAIADRDRAAIH